MQKILNLTAKEFTRIKLQEAMEEVSDTPLLLVVAPSGYGKSTLVRQYFAKHRELTHIWFPFQRNEMDEIWLWQRVCRKTAERNPELGRRMEQMGFPQSPQELSYMIQLIQKYVTHPVYLILDDFQEGKSSAMNRLIEAIAQEETYFHFIIISRIYPDIAYEELFLKGKCALLNQQNLTLTKEETEEICRKNQIEPEKEELDRLYQYTDGWISAVYLSLFEYKRNGGFGCFYGVNRLLKTVIFDKLTPQMQEFYMKVSLFEWFDTEGASYVTEMEITESMLFECREQFGFLAYDEERHTFVMHALLRNVAETELRKSNIDVSRLYNRAGELREKRKSYVMAVRYYSMGKNWEKIAGLYAGEHGKKLLAQAPEIFEELREPLNEHIWNRDIRALLNYLYFLAMRDAKETFIPKYEAIEHAIKTSEKWSRDSRVAAEMKVILSAVQYNDLEKMKQSIEEAQRLLAPQTSFVLDGSLLTYGTTCMTVLYYRESGTLKQIIQMEKEYAKYYMQLTKGGRSDWDTFFDAEYAMLTGDLREAYTYAGKALEQAEFRKQTCIMISCYYIRMRSLIYEGNTAEFEKMMQEMKEKLESVADMVLRTDMELVEGYMYACLGRTNQVPAWLRNFKLEDCSRQIRSSRSGCMTYGKILIAEEKWEMLELIGEQMLEPYQSIQQIQSQVAGSVYKAIAKSRMGQKEAAAACLKEAVALAEPDDLKIPFIENGKEIKPIMDELENCAFLSNMKEAMEQYEKGVACFTVTQGQKTPLLTKRERELMEYVKAGYRNAQIAKEMHIAQVTVEKNLTSVYRKLQVKNRTTAIKKLDELEKN